MSAVFHPTDDMLMAHSAGTLDEAMALLVASHLSYCPQCRLKRDQLDAVGGALFAAVTPAPVGDAALDQIMARLDQTPMEPAGRRPIIQGPPEAAALPAPLRRYIGQDLNTVAWKRLGKGLEQALVVDSGRARARLYRIAPEVRIPDHGHRGQELTLVLQGGFHDQNGQYGPGDVASADGQTEHSPQADPGEPCICLAVTDAPLRLKGLVGRLISPFLNL